MASILLVDDDSSVLLTSSIALRRSGHEVMVACDGHQALNQLSRHRYDVVITDIRMPGMSGLELATHVRSLPEAPCLILTSAHYDPSMQPNPAAIADIFLQKPLDIGALCDIVDSTRLGHPLGSCPAPGTLIAPRRVLADRRDPLHRRPIPVDHRTAQRRHHT